MYEPKHRHIVDAVIALHESGILDAEDLSQFSTEELLAVVAHIGAECIALEDRHALLEAAQGPLIEELNKVRGVKLLRISRLLRRPDDGADATVAFRALKKWHELVQDAQAFASGQRVSNRRNARFLTIVNAAAEEHKVVDVWWRRILKAASNHVLAVPACLAGMLGIKAAAGSSGGAVGGGMLGMSVTTQVAAGATALVVATTVVVADDPVPEQTRRQPEASSIVAEEYRRVRESGQEDRAVIPTYPRDTDIPVTVPTLTPIATPTTTAKSTSVPTPEPSGDVEEPAEEPPMLLAESRRRNLIVSTPTMTATPKPQVSTAPRPKKSPAPTPTSYPTVISTVEPGPTLTASPAPTGPVLSPSPTPSVQVSTPPGTPSASPSPESVQPTRGFVDELIHLADMIL